MPCLHLQLSVNGSSDLVDTERLRLHGIGWLGKDDIPLLQHLCMDAICRTDADSRKDILISKADKALYAVKNSGKNNYLIFEED